MWVIRFQTERGDDYYYYSTTQPGKETLEAKRRELLIYDGWDDEVGGVEGALEHGLYHVIVIEVPELKATKELAKKCSHPLDSLIDYRWEWDNGYGVQKWKTGKQCTCCRKINNWWPYGTWGEQ